MEEIQNTENTEDVGGNVLGEPEIVIESEKLFAPQRLEGETYADYRERRLVANYKLHEMAKGRLIWNSRPDPMTKGNTFRKEK